MNKLLINGEIGKSRKFWPHREDDIDLQELVSPCFVDVSQIADDIDNYYGSGERSSKRILSRIKILHHIRCSFACYPLSGMLNQ